MRYSIATALLASATYVAADNCIEDGGNWYCNKATHIKYTNVGGTGSYDAVSLMDSSGTCNFGSSSYSGGIAPLDQQVSIHCRGPLQLKQFAAYAPGSSSSKKRSVNAHHHHHRRHGHGHQHVHEKRGQDWVTATIDGQVVSWVNDYNPGATPAGDKVKSDHSTKAGVAAAAATTAASTSKGSSKGSSSSSSSSSSSGSDYSRIGYYNAEDSTADGIVFLGNYGGSGSGAWSSTWGNTLSYLNSNGDGCAASSEVLANTLIPSNKEFAIFTDTECSGDDCGYYQDGTVAYKGFDGGQKVFLFEFKMPLDGDTGFNGDMPAIWMLNALIPRTAQYSSCSCWTTGCGEFDVFEVLASGDERAKTTLHTNTPGGSSDFFERPTTDYIKIGVVLDSESNSVAVKKLDDDYDFGTGLSSEDVTDMLGNDDDSGLTLFGITS